MSRPYTSGNACNYSYFNANNAGAQICVVGAATASLAGAAAGEGVLHSISLSDTGALSVTIYDGTSTSGPVAFKNVFGAGGGSVTFTLDIQLKFGIFIVISGATAANVNLSWS